MSPPQGGRGSGHDAGERLTLPPSGISLSEVKNPKGSKLKRCYRCKQEHPETDFAPDSSKAGGRKSICRACDRQKARDYYARRVG